MNDFLVACQGPFRNRRFRATGFDGKRKQTESRLNNLGRFVSGKNITPNGYVIGHRQLPGGQFARHGSGLQWREPIEGLDFGEVWLGGIASTYLGRDRSIGYAILFTDRMIIGVRLRRITQAILLPYMIAIGALYILTVFVLGSGSLLLLFLPIVLWGAGSILRVLWRRFSERVISHRESNPALLVKRNRDFEVKRDTIGELMMKNPPRGLTLGLDKGYLKTFRKNEPAEPIEIKIHAWQPSQELRDLVISFSSREPKVRAMEYPSRL